MKMRHCFALIVSAACLMSLGAAIAGNTTFLTDRNGQVVFPISPPNRANSTPGAIDNMAIGQTTPAPGAFSSLIAPGTTAAAATTPTGNGGTALVKGGAGGATSGNGGVADVFGGDAAAGNGNGGDVNLIGGAANGSGVNGVIRQSGVRVVSQGAPAAATTSATLTAANVLTGIITVNQAGGANSAQQLPLATAMDTALPTSGAGDSFDFSVVNISVVSGETSSVTTNTGWTLVGGMTQAITTSARFRARKTGTGAWTLYRLS